MPNIERDESIGVLQSYYDRFTAIMDMIGSSHGLTGSKKHEAQELFRELKEDLKDDCKEYYRRREGLNKYEDAFVEPALRKASANIQSAWNAIPNQKVHSDLYGARIDISHALHGLQQLPANWSPSRQGEG